MKTKIKQAMVVTRQTVCVIAVAFLDAIIGLLDIARCYFMMRVSQDNFVKQLK